MKVITCCLFFIISSNSFAEDGCNCPLSESSLPHNLVTLAETAGKVVGVGDLSRVREVTKNEFPFVGRFRSQGELPESCTGSLIDKDTVLTAGHCADLLGKAPMFIISRDPFDTKGAAPAGLISKGDDWAYYKLEAPINYNGPYPQIRSMSVSELKNKTLMSVGYPVEESGSLINKLVVDEKCTVFGQTFITEKFLSNCFSRKGTSGGPLFYAEDQKYFIVGVRSGPKWGILRKVFNQVGTAETPARFFKDRDRSSPSD
jgi:hypothetical protein